ncbi:5-formyltetrahydrofolate cyclo-ligase [Fontisphaera persica]|uniref:5-formyltetrahydrofolate cyclo-ligase n=1 Tax=Fontisphaera persica TaxID=2974023 RepID=UPI0024C0AFDF|nr:5-formyltetrahydrofolate cyclo-ligase [Fontisphaera persica]WCJ58784.1 5-formyltetrahydrofolate cyclo-ligase [Fontisphaera persica]
MNPAEIKAQWRRRMRERLRQVPAAERARASAALVEVLAAQPLWQAAKTVLLYSALPDELEVSALLAAALAQGKRVGLPAFDVATGGYKPREVRDLGRDLAPGRYGILEPGPETVEISLKLLDLVVVPALGFNQDGVRLGRGAGYYDRMLAGFAGQKWGVGYAWQVGLDFPGEPQDVAMEAVATPSGLQPMHGRG